MSDTGLARRKQMLLDKFLAGEIDKQPLHHPGEVAKRLVVQPPKTSILEASPSQP